MTPILSATRTGRDPVTTSRIMASVRSVNSRCELTLRHALWRRGWRYRLHAQRAAGMHLPGRPDLVFVRQRLVVFIDGDFWHGRTLITDGEAALAARFRPEKRVWWVGKISGNVARDRKHDRILRAAGWRVLRVWESDILRDASGVVARIERALRREQT